MVYERLSLGLGRVVGFQVANVSLFFCQSVRLLEKSSFNITLSRSETEWNGLLKCLAPLLLDRMLFCDCSY